MTSTRLNWSVNNISKLYQKNEVLSFEHPVQRQGGMWSIEQKSLLIHSMLSNYPIPNIYVLRESNEQDEKNKFDYSVLDGKQRLTSVLSYIYGEYPLAENTPNVYVEDNEYIIANKFFCDLDEAVQYEIKRYKFDIVAFENCNNREIEEIFLRLNNGVELTKSQKAKAKAGIEVGSFINEMLASKFFTVSCNFTNKQIQASDDQKSLIQAMMLLDTNYEGLELKDFSENSIMEYAKSLRKNFSSRQQNLIRSAIEYLGDTFPNKNKVLRKIHIPMLVYLADYAEDHEIKPLEFRVWWNYFTEEDELFEIYKGFCSTGSTKPDKIKGRLAVMAKSFCAYHEIDLPDELTDMVAEVEEKITAYYISNGAGDKAEESHTAEIENMTAEDMTAEDKETEIGDKATENVTSEDVISETSDVENMATEDMTTEDNNQSDTD